ncbi:hypothetical protein F5Y03DRAFT_409059 [Xylaria venustula]|nr:hypothetical protein F5Y03DRAFT_409059 [Xylaria venustula]
MSAIQPKKTRRGGQRSRKGCENCKARHIKCDETRPYCQRCLQKGMVCGGYSALDTNQQAAIAVVASPITAYAIPFRIPGSQQDRRLLHYFCVQGAGDLSGHLSSDFWTRLVLQHSHAHVSVRQAVVALSCAHQGYITSADSDGSVPTDAVLYYSKAMRSLRKHMSADIDNKGEVSPMIPLICCILFFCIENSQGNTEAALRHLNSGIAILSREKERGPLATKSRDDEHLDIVEHMLARLDLQASMFDDGRLPLMKHGAAIESEVSASNTFKSIDDAQAGLTKLQGWELQFLISNERLKFRPENNLPDEVKLEKQAIEGAWAEWSKKLDRFAHDQSTPHAEHGGDHANNAVITILRIHYQIFRLLSSATLPYDPSVFAASPGSPHYSAMNKLLNLIESTPQVREGSSRSLGAETGIIPPLFLIIMKCTDPAIFKRAFTLLLTISGRREGMFDSRVLVKIAMRFASQDQTQAEAVALEWQAGDALHKSVNGLDGLAKNLGIAP